MVLSNDTKYDMLCYSRKINKKEILKLFGISNSTYYKIIRDWRIIYLKKFRNNI